MRSTRAAAVAKSLLDAAVVLAPALFATEVANALWKYVGSGDLPSSDALDRREEALALVDTFVPDAALGAESLAEAIRRSHPVYDLLYAVLARRHGASVLTFDRRLAKLLGQMEVPALSPGS